MGNSSNTKREPRYSHLINSPDKTFSDHATGNKCVNKIDKKSFSSGFEHFGKQMIAVIGVKKI